MRSIRRAGVLGWCGVGALGLFFGAMCVATVSCRPAVPTGPERIILIVVDTLRADRVGAYGAPAPTAQMDALARDGQHFEDVVSAFHMTSTSMGAMFTGNVPSIENEDPSAPLVWSSESFCGLARFRLVESDACVPESLDTLAEGLSGLGYWTVGVTANPLLFDPNGYSQGFDSWHEIGIVKDRDDPTQIERRAAAERTGVQIHDRLFDVLRARESDHFFLFVQYLDVHDWLPLKRSYNRGVQVFDDHLGQLRAFLEEEGLWEGTVVVLTSDHGEMLSDAHPVKPLPLHLGNPSYEGVLRVPLIVSPAAFGSADGMIRGDDLRAMILSMAAGTPTLPPDDGAREHFIGELKFQTYTRGGFKSIWPRNRSAPILLDLEADPAETTDVSKAHPEVLAEHRRRLDELTTELGLGEAPTPTSISLDAVDRLRALGYLDLVEE